MENIGLYFFIALVIGLAAYLTLKKKKVTHPTADEERVFSPKAPSKSKTKNQIPKKDNSPKERKTGASQAPSPAVAASQNDLENEVKQLQARTGWDYDTAKAYCQQAAEYHQKIAEPARLKNN